MISCGGEAFSFIGTLPSDALTTTESMGSVPEHCARCVPLPTSFQMKCLDAGILAIIELRVHH